MKECKEAEARGNFEKRIKVLVKKGGMCYTVYTATDGYGDAKVSTGIGRNEKRGGPAKPKHGQPKCKRQQNCCDGCLSNAFGCYRTVLRQTSRPFAHEYHGMGESVKKW